MYHAEFVCMYCFEDAGLIGFIRTHVSANECSFCSSSRSYPIAAPMHLVSEHFTRCLFQEYDLAVEQLGWSGREGGWIGGAVDAEELAYHVLELEFPQDNGDTLLPLLFGEYADQDWCEANAYGLNDQEVARYSWEHFCRVVKQERRFFFLRDEGDPGEPDVYCPGDVLETIFEYAARMNLLKEMPAGSLVFRARWEGSIPHLEGPEELGPPPPEMANQPNRMSPAGISMFYGSDDEETALRETSRGASYFAVGCFETLRPIVLLDLTTLPPVPELFDPIPDGTEVPTRRILKFLHHVTTEMSRRIERDGREHVEYVPTQIVTEFIRDQLTWDNRRVDGIKYSSSVHPGHVSCVLFANQRNIFAASTSQDSDDEWLKLTQTTHRWTGSKLSLWLRFPKRISCWVSQVSMRCYKTLHSSRRS